MNITEEIENVSTEELSKILTAVLGFEVTEKQAFVCQKITPLHSAQIIQDPNKLAWLAGLFEGEGSVFTVKKYIDGYNYPAFCLQINMTDRDVIERVTQYSSVGIFSGPRPQTGKGHKPIWTWKVNKKVHVYFLCLLLKPLMGERRAGKMEEVIGTFENYAGTPRWRHGTRNGYERLKCKCALCREYNTRRLRSYRLKKQLKKEQNTKTLNKN